MTRSNAQSHHYIHKIHERISIKDIIGIIIGSFVIACGIQFIIVPAHIFTGGVSGITIILHFLTGSPLWLWYIGLNIPIFLAGYRLVSGRFALYSLLGTLAVAMFLAIFSYQDFHLPLNDLLLSSLLGGTINGLGIGIILRNRGSSGGLDIIAAIAHRYWGFNLGITFFSVNLLVLAFSLVQGKLELSLYSAITMFLTSKVIDAVNGGLDVKKTTMIVSGHADDISLAIMHNMNRGCTFISGKGGYTGKMEDIIMVTVNQTQLPKLKDIIFHLDPEAFITISDTVEVYGRGFKTTANEF